MPIDAIIFDMDGVLVLSEPFIIEASQQMFRETYGLAVKPEDFLPFVGTGEDRFIGGVAEKYGVALTMPRDKERTYALYLQLIPGRLHPTPGAVDFIRSARADGLKLAVASSADRVKVDGNLGVLGLADGTFDAVVTGSDVTRKKPDPQTFLLAAQRLGIDPSRCVVIEDATSGVRAAKAAGSRCLALTTTFTTDELRAAGADFITGDLAHVPAEVLA